VELKITNKSFWLLLKANGNNCVQSQNGSLFILAVHPVVAEESDAEHDGKDESRAEEHKEGEEEAPKG